MGCQDEVVTAFVRVSIAERSLAAWMPGLLFSICRRQMSHYKQTVYNAAARACNRGWDIQMSEHAGRHACFAQATYYTEEAFDQPNS
jgi:hypothetical protein